MRGEPIRFANVAGEHVGDGSTAVSLADYIAQQMDPGLTWKDAEWLRSVWDGPIVLKGIQTVADAKIAADEGIEAIALSNHGGRQLDSAPAIADLVAPVADAVGDRIEIICDGGIRRGSDIVKAVALGARACMAGRAYLYGLGAAGERGRRPRARPLRRRHAPHHGAHRRPRRRRPHPRPRLHPRPPLTASAPSISGFAYVCGGQLRDVVAERRQRPGRVPPSTV